MDFGDLDYGIPNYDREGRPISMQRAAELKFFTPDYHRVCGTVLMDAADPELKMDISTVWLGLDHGWLSDGAAPLIFETMIFTCGDDDHELSQWCRRYSTEEQARTGHAEALELAKAAMADPVVLESIDITLADVTAKSAPQD